MNQQYLPRLKHWEARDRPFYSSSGTLQPFRWPALPLEGLHVFSASRDSCRFRNVSRRKLLQSDPFVNEQPALPADAAAVSGKTPPRIVLRGEDRKEIAGSTTIFSDLAGDPFRGTYEER